MKTAFTVVFMTAGAALAGCGTPGTAEEFTWAIENPKTVDKGAEFLFTVKATNAAGAAVDGVKFRYQILWTGGSSNPLRHSGRTGEAQRLHARMVAGPATIVVTSSNRDGLETKVVECTFEVKS